MGAHVKNTLTPFSQVANTVPWPRHPSTSSCPSSSTSRPTKVHRPGGHSTQPVVVPHFVSNPYILANYGYQEVHRMYDKMRQWFAKRATSTYQNEVATIKVTLMLLKPGHRNPQIVLVCKDDVITSLDAE